MAWSRDGQQIASVGSYVLVWDLRQPSEPTVLPVPPCLLRALTFSPDGTRLAGAGEDGNVYLWDTTSTADPLTLAGHYGPVTSVTFSTNGRNLITSDEEGTVRIWPTNDPSHPLVLDGFRATVEAVTSLPDGRYVTAHDDGTIRIWRCPVCGPISEVLDQADQHITRQFTVLERDTYLPADR